MRRPAVWLLVVAMLAVQLLGVVHRVTHAGQGHGSGPSHATGLAAPDNPKGLVAPTARGAFAALFAGHGSERDCDAYDQMSHADSAFAASPDLRAEPVVAVPVVFHPAWHIAAQAWGCLARGPPIVA